MYRDYLFAAGVWVGVVAILGVILGSLGFVQSECLQGTPFFPAIFYCTSP
jgi:hypothetical protein